MSVDKISAPQNTAEEIEKLKVEYNIADFFGLADWATFEAGISKGLKAAADFVRNAPSTAVGEPQSSADLLILVKLFRDTLQYYIRRDEKTGDIEGAALKRNTLGIVMNAIATAEGLSELSMLETHLKSLISSEPEKALLAALDDDMRMRFVAQLTSIASANVPLTEIEALVSRHLTPAKGGAA